MSGRPPKPSRLKEFEGNPGKRTIKDTPEPQKLLKCPQPSPGLGKWGRRLWKRYAFGVWSMGLLTAVDVPAWESMCRSFQESMDALEQLKGAKTEDGKNGEKKHPLYTIYQQERENFQRMMKEFGMTPLSRERIEPDKPNSDDEFNNFMQN